ncbi:membrane dipeptidase [Paralcaligenes ureilyticus]|uniref:Membrane dipeptidase n=1 Tax=Paralcaligenes ureilyticus TaxID=627131 RepID=A0A4R3MB42_9BURK|nr:membrane dipeptidase [Paralcaligenes ureilyticus]TCT10844.1 membrane dipeptidase [Paralcaligenes ureilyticus]
MQGSSAIPQASSEAKRFTQETFVFDCLSLFYVLDEPWAERCLQAGVNAVNVTFGTDQNWGDALRNFDVGLEKIAKSSHLALATNGAQIESARKQGRLAVIVGTQGSAMVDLDFHRLRTMARMGMRYFGLAYTGATLFADGCGERRDAGLTFAGEELIDAVNELDLILDLSHAGHRARAEGVVRARHPVCTHSNAYTVNANDRNTRDETARAIGQKGGVMGVCGLPRSVRAADPTLNDMLDHGEHWIRTVGVENVGLGLDFTEGYKAAKKLMPASVLWRTRRPDIFGSVDEFLTQDYPRGLSTILELANFTQGMFDRGYTREQTAAVLGGNWLRHFTSVNG